MIDTSQMVATPRTSNKRGHSEAESLTTSEDSMALLAMNRALEDIKHSIEFDLNLEINEERRTLKSHQYLLMEMLQDADATDLLLFILT